MMILMNVIPPHINLLDLETKWVLILNSYLLYDEMIFYIDMIMIF